MSVESLGCCSPQGNLTQSGRSFSSILSVVVSREGRRRQLVRSCPCLFSSHSSSSIPLPYPSQFIPLPLSVGTRGVFPFQQPQRKSHHLMSSLFFRKWDESFLLFSPFFLSLSHFPAPLSLAVSWTRIGARKTKSHREFPSYSVTNAE